MPPGVKVVVRYSTTYLKPTMQAHAEKSRIGDVIEIPGGQYLQGLLELGHVEIFQGQPTAGEGAADVAAAPDPSSDDGSKEKTVTEDGPSLEEQEEPSRRRRRN